MQLSPCQRGVATYNAALPFGWGQEANGHKTGCDHHGQSIRLGHDEACRRDVQRLKIGHQALIVSAHRTPGRLYEFARNARKNGFKVIIAGAGGAAHLPGMTAAMTPLPVLGVPMKTHALEGKDSLLSIMQMPGGIPVGTLAIGKPGAINAALLAAAVLALSDAKVAKRLDAWRAQQTKSVAKKPRSAWIPN